MKSESESCSVVSDSLQPHGLYSPWNSPGQNTGVGSLPLLQGIFPTQGSNQVSCIAGRFFTNWATREAQAYNYKYMLNNVKKNVNMMIRKNEDFQKTHMKRLKI